MISGLDASNVNGALNWRDLKTQYGLSFVMLKASEGTGFLDPLFPAAWEAARELGLARGAYHFGHPSEDAARQADAFLGYVRSCGLDDGDILALDHEVSDGLPPGDVAGFGGRFCSLLHSGADRLPALYTFLSFAEEGNCAGLGSYPLWIADPSSTPGRPRVPAPWKTWAVHQYGQQGLDLDVANYPDKAAMTRALGKRSPSPPAPKPAPPEDDVQSGQLNQGPNAVTVISVPWDTASNIAFGCDNGLQGLPPAKLRVAVYDTAWHVTASVIVDCTKGQAVVHFPDKTRTGIISVRREDAGDVAVGWQVS